MSQQLIEELREVNLCTYYVLPLLKLSKFSFLRSNFLNSYLTPDGSDIVVEIVEPLLLSRNVLTDHQYRGKFKRTNSTCLVYRIPQKWGNDIVLFMEGKFSHMTRAAKEAIKRFSGLDNRKKGKDGVPLTDGRLLALDKHPVLKKMWESELSSITPSQDGKSTQRSVVELGEDAELLSIPGKESYISLEGLVLI